MLWDYVIGIYYNFVCCCVLVFINWQWCLCCSIKQLSLPMTSPVLTLSHSFRYIYYIYKVCLYVNLWSETMKFNSCLSFLNKRLLILPKKKFCLFAVTHLFTSKKDWHLFCFHRWCHLPCFYIPWGERRSSLSQRVILIIVSQLLCRWRHCFTPFLSQLPIFSTW